MSEWEDSGKTCEHSTNPADGDQLFMLNVRVVYLNKCADYITEVDF